MTALLGNNRCLEWVMSELEKNMQPLDDEGKKKRKVLMNLYCLWNVFFKVTEEIGM